MRRMLMKVIVVVFFSLTIIFTEEIFLHDHWKPAQEFIDTQRQEREKERAEWRQHINKMREGFEIALFMPSFSLAYFEAESDYRMAKQIYESDKCLLAKARNVFFFVVSPLFAAFFLVSLVLRGQDKKKK